MMTELNKLRYEGGETPVEYFSFVVSGPDAESFLHGQTTNNIQKISNQHFALDTLLDISGRVICYFWVMKVTMEMYNLVFDREELALLGRERLEKYLIAEDVELSEIKKRNLVFTFDPRNKFKKEETDFVGDYFGESCTVSFDKYPTMHQDFLKELMLLRGFDREASLQKLITDSILFELALDLKKGCFLGQETIGKIAFRRGAAFYPMALKVDRLITGPFPLKLTSEGKKIGTILGEFSLGRDNYLLSSLIRDFRVENYVFHAEVEGTEYSLTAKSFPLMNYSNEEKASELYDEAVSLFQADQEEMAIKLLELAIEINPSFEDAYESLGVILGRHEKFEDAILLMKKLSEVNSKSVMAHTNMSMYYMKLGNIEEAEKHKSEATVKTFEYYGDEAKRKAAEKKAHEEKVSDRERRESMFKEVLEIDPEDSLALFGLSDIEFEKGNFEKALPYTLKVLETNPKYSVAYLLAGKLLIALNKKDEAKKRLQEGIKIASSQGELMPANEMQRILGKL